MKKEILMAVVFLAIASGAFGAGFKSFPAGAEPTGFRGIGWGAPIVRLKGMRPEKDSSENVDVKSYVRQNENLRYDGAKLTKIAYGFYKGRFFQVVLTTSGKKDYEKLKAALFRKYGRTDVRQMGFSGAYIWQGPETTMMLSMFQVLGNTEDPDTPETLNIFSTKIEKESREQE